MVAGAMTSSLPEIQGGGLMIVMETTAVCGARIIFTSQVSS